MGNTPAQPANAPIHYRIHIYDNARPPLGEPVPVSLCPWRRGRNGELSGDVDQVTCALCLRHIRELGLANFRE